MGEPLLAVRDLRVAYVGADGPVDVVHGVSFDLHRGEVLGLVGESGSGKSTLAQALLRTLPPPGLVTGGTARLGDVDLLTLSPAALRALRWTRVSLVPQAALSSLNPVLTVGQHLDDTLQAHGFGDRAARRSRGAALLALVELTPDVAGRYPHELSGGMRQRVAIALALALTPELVVFDEPTTALDALVEHQVLGRIAALQAELGFAALFISHDLALVRRFAARVGVLRDGVMVETVATAALPDGAQHPYTRQLLAAMPAATAPARDARLVPSAPADHAPLLEVDGLARDVPSGPWWSRARTRIVDDVSFAVRRGEVVALVGASGSGKSTLAGLVARLTDPSAGRVRLDGQDAAALPLPVWRRRVQLVLQDPYASLNPVHTVGHHLRRPLLRHGHATAATVDARVDALLTTVGLTPPSAYVDRHPHALSGGQRQRVAIARALAVDPDVLVADEPTSMLDVSLRMDVLALLSRLRDERRLALLFITHDLAAARHLADRIVVLDRGRVVEDGPADVVALSPTHPVTRRLLQASP